jgi:hypothetical protein
MTAIVLVQLTALSIVFVRLVESMNAVLLALLVALVPMLPSAVFLYRPDLFAGRPELAAVTVLANLVWYDATMAWLGPLLRARSLLKGRQLAFRASIVISRSDCGACRVQRVPPTHPVLDILNDGRCTWVGGCCHDMPGYSSHRIARKAVHAERQAPPPVLASRRCASDSLDQMLPMSST